MDASQSGERPGNSAVRCKSKLRDSYPCVVKNKPYSSSIGLLRMAQAQRYGIDSVRMPLSISEL